MNFRRTELEGVVVVELEPHVDERGIFTRTFDADLFAGAGLCSQMVQCSSSFNPRAGTLRGMHYQLEPHGECKLVRCSRGRVFDVAVDLRRDSPTHRRWYGIELSARNGVCLFMPEGVAHGFQTLEDDTEVDYQMNAPYVPDAGRGVRWDDCAFAIDWPDLPAGERIVSQRDSSFPDYAP